MLIDALAFAKAVQRYEIIGNIGLQNQVFLPLCAISCRKVSWFGEKVVILWLI